ncbi:hypothetical protein B0H19DRAFT_1264917 [Mycena capillaripes]|nr:hypothetical protein B0H19DRAFT_1264917 [Mycena capillaripes]
MDLLCSQPISDPKLPPELERMIFELAALSRSTNIPVLLRTAWRVKNWVEPLLYRVVFLSKGSSQRPVPGFPSIPVDILLDVIAKKPPSFFASATKYLFLHDGTENLQPSTVAAIVAACPRVTDLSGHFSSSKVLCELGGLQCLRRLALHPDLLFAPSGDFAHPFLRNITHLELFTTFCRPADLCAGVALIPHLTHVSFNNIFQVAEVQAMLREDVRLRCIVFLFLGPMHQYKRGDYTFTDDIRCVSMEWTDFDLYRLRGAATAEDYWALADKLIAAKRAGTVDRSIYSICETDDWWRT